MFLVKCDQFVVSWGRDIFQIRIVGEIGECGKENAGRERGSRFCLFAEPEPGRDGAHSKRGLLDENFQRLAQSCSRALNAVFIGDDEAYDQEVQAIDVGRGERIDESQDEIKALWWIGHVNDLDIDV